MLIRQYHSNSSIRMKRIRVLTLIGNYRRKLELERWFNRETTDGATGCFARRASSERWSDPRPVENGPRRTGGSSRRQDDWSVGTVPAERPALNLPDPNQKPAVPSAVHFSIRTGQTLRPNRRVGMESLHPLRSLGLRKRMVSVTPGGFPLHSWFLVLAPGVAGA